MRAMNTRPLLAIITLSLATRAAAQSAEPSQWDALVAVCSGSTPQGSTLGASITQIAVDTVQVSFSGYLPSYVYLTNEVGTVIAYTTTVPNTGVVTLTWPDAKPGEQPLDVTAHSCPPAASSAAKHRAWRGQYEDALAMCCAISAPSTADAAAYTPTLQLDWDNQRVRMSAPSRAPLLNYVRDSTGLVLRVDANSGGVSGGYTSQWAPFTRLATSVTTCALLADGDINPLCASASTLEQTATDLEYGASNPVSIPSLASLGVNVSTEGTTSATFSTNQRAGWCILYLRNSTSAANETANAGPVTAFANASSLSIELGSVTSRVTLYSCCAVYVAPSGRATCPDTRLYSTVVDVAALKVRAAAEAAQALTSAGALSYAAAHAPGASCGGHVVGAVAVNATGRNCTCVAGPTSYDPPQWACDDLPPTYPAIHISSILIIIVVPLLTVSLVLGCLIALRASQRPGDKPLVQTAEVAMDSLPQGDRM